MSVERYERAYFEMQELLEQGATEEAAVVLSGVDDYATAGLEPSQLAWFALLATEVHASCGRIERAVASASRCDDVACSGGDPEPAVHAYAQLLLALDGAEDEGEGVRAFSALALEALERIDDWLSEPEAHEDPNLAELFDSAVWIRLVAGRIAFAEGEAENAERHFGRACDDAVACAFHAEAALAAGYLASIRCDHDPIAALEVADLAVRHAEAAGVAVDDDIPLVRASASYLLGRTDDVLRYAHEAEQAYAGERSARAYRVRILRDIVDSSPETTDDLALINDTLASEEDPLLQGERVRALCALAGRWIENGRPLDAVVLLEDAAALFADIDDPGLQTWRERTIETIRVTFGQNHAQDAFEADLRSGDRIRVFRAIRSAVHRANAATTRAALAALERNGFTPASDAECVDVAMLRVYEETQEPESATTAQVLGESRQIFTEAASSTTADAETRLIAARGMAFVESATDHWAVVDSMLANLDAEGTSVAERLAGDLYVGAGAAVTEDRAPLRPGSREWKSVFDRFLPAFVVVEALRFRFADASTRTALLVGRTHAVAAMAMFLAETAGDTSLHAQLTAVIAASGWHDLSEGLPEDLRSLDLSDPLGRAVPGTSVPVAARLLHGGEDVALRPPPWLRMPDGRIALLEATFTAVERYGIPLEELRSPGIVDLAV